MKTHKQKPIPNHKLRRARRNLLLTIKEAAEMVGASVTSFGRWERGIQNPQPIMLRNLCRVFNKTPEELGFEDFRAYYFSENLSAEH